MEAKKTKLEEQFIENAASVENNKKSQIFKGISIFVNGYTCKCKHVTIESSILNSLIFKYFEYNNCLFLN